MENKENTKEWFERPNKIKGGIVKKESNNNPFIIYGLIILLIIVSAYWIKSDIPVVADYNESYKAGFQNGSLYTLNVINYNLLDQLYKNYETKGLPSAEFSVYDFNVNQTYNLRCEVKQ